MSTQLTGDLALAFVEVKIQLTADAVAFTLAISACNGSGNIWRYNLSEASEHNHNWRLAYGRIVAPDYHAAVRKVVGILGQGYEPGSIERGLFDMLGSRERVNIPPANQENN
jgi:hypothetical protein